MNNKTIWLPLLLIVLVATAHGAEPTPAAVVVAFNKSISDRKLDAALSMLATGSMQYTLRAAHVGATTGADSMTSDLKNHWRTVGPVLFGATKSYDRVATVEQTHAEGDLATVWARIASKTVERNGKQRSDQFSEVYLLVRSGKQWQIGAIAGNRGTDSLAVEGPDAR